MFLCLLLALIIFLLLLGKIQKAKQEVAAFLKEPRKEPQKVVTEISSTIYPCRHLLVRLVYQDVYETGSVAVDFSAYGEDEAVLGFTSFIKGTPPTESEEDINGQYCDIGPGAIIKVTDSLTGQVAWDFTGGFEDL